MTRKVAATSLIHLPRAASWSRLRDISLAHHYVPGIVRTVVVSDHAEGVGASRYVYRSTRRFLQETVEEWVEGEGFLLRLHKGDKPAPPFREAYFRYQLADDEPGTTRLHVSMEYSLPWGALGGWLEKVLEKQVQGAIQDVAIALALYYETGEPTTAAALKAAKTGR